MPSAFSKWHRASPHTGKLRSGALTALAHDQPPRLIWIVPCLTLLCRPAPSRQELKLETGEKPLWRTKANCLRICAMGPVMVVYPDQVGRWPTDTGWDRQGSNRRPGATVCCLQYQCVYLLAGVLPQLHPGGHRAHPAGAYHRGPRGGGVPHYSRAASTKAVAARSYPQRHCPQRLP